MWLLHLLILVSALGCLRALYRAEQTGVYLFKPLTTLLIAALALLQPTHTSPGYQMAVLAGLLCSLAGDVFLMLPKDRFIPGLVSFLLAHLCYLFAFTRGAGPVLNGLALLPFLVAAVFLLRLLWPHLGRLRLPVLVYAAILALMCWQALGRWIATPDAGTLAAAGGAVLFLLSDATLALNRFVGSFRYAQLVVMSTYYAAQWLIACSV
jgi:uncharacterized membrane protein YhhN